jgi:TM2 domain-containing membrane protein YozV
MSSGVSQIEYWLGSSKDKSATQKNDGKQGGEGAVYLSYDVFMGLAIIGGFLALDHLYLRSPLTFLAKIIINIMFFGVWWLYDAAQAVFNDDVVKVFGLGVPGLGPKGIAAGVLANDVPDKKHMRFFLYALALVFAGLFGVDSFLVGDKTSGFIRLISLITFIFAPVALGWWLYKLFKFFFDTKGVVDENYEYFGAPSPPETSVVDQLKSKIPIVGSILDPVLVPVRKVTGALERAADGAVDFVDAIVENPAAAVGTVLQGPLGEILSPLKSTADLALQTIDDSAQAVAGVTKLGQSAVNTVGQTAKAAATALQLAPMAAGISTSLTPQSIQAAQRNLAQQGGGETSNMLAYALIGTFGIIAVSGFILTYRRSRQNVKPRKDDSPPEPTVLRESDKEEPTQAT